VLTAALDILREDGLGTGVERISLGRAVERARVPRASAYRLWSHLGTSPQLAFQHELLNHLAAQDIGGERDLGTTTLAATRVLERAGPPSDLAPAERWQLMRELIRIATAANLDAMTVSPMWQAWIGVVGAAASRNVAADEEFHHAIWLGEERATTRYVGLFQTMAAAFGIRLRAPYSYRHFATAAAALAEGLAMRDRVSGYVRNIERSTGTDGVEQKWTLFAVAMEGLVRQFFEADPDSPHPTPIPPPAD
jgi:hypothetical protein